MKRAKVWAIAGPLEGLGPATIRYLLSREQAVIALAPDTAAAGSLREWSGSGERSDRPEVVDMSPERREDAYRSLDQLLERYGAIDILINHLGYGLIDGLDPAGGPDMMDSMDNNLRDTIETIKLILPYMNHHPNGYVISLPLKPCVLGVSGEPVYDQRATAVAWYAEALERALTGLDVKITYFANGPESRDVQIAPDEQTPPRRINNSMAHPSQESKNIDLHRNIPDILPVKNEGYENWSIRVIRRAPHTCKNYLSPNRREFYKIMYVTKGIGLFTIGLKNYYIDQPTILFLHPNEIISWKKLNTESEGFICFFRKSMADTHPLLKAQIDKYQLFTDSTRSVIRLGAPDIAELDRIFLQMEQVDIVHGGALAEDAMQAYLLLLMITSTKTARYAGPDAVSDEFRHIHDFFQLLEKETANVNYDTPVQIKTAREFADKLFVHPNHLNLLLKKHTGVNLSAHIKNRLLEESKVLLLRTDWTLQNIGYAIGFSDQPNFSQFFKKSTGMTPAEYRKSKSE